jgi:rieske iron-sulfur protein
VSDVGYPRRTLLRGAIGLGLTLPIASVHAAQEDDPKKARPQAGDRLVFFSGDLKGQVIKPDALTLGGPQVLAYPMDPATDTVRNGSRLNQVLVIRLEPAQLSQETSANAAEGVVAYSAACSHEACPVSMWKNEKGGVLYCACHGSEYDPRDAAKVVGGPAPRRLAMLPLKMEGGELVAAGPFTGKVGAAKR